MKSTSIKLIGIILSIFFMVPFFYFFPTALNAESENAIQTANYFLLSGATLEDEETLHTLSLYDLIVIPAEARVYNPEFADEIRKINPDITILAYVPTVSWNTIWTDSLHQTLYQGIESSFWLNTVHGEILSIWPGTYALDLTSDWNTYLAKYVHEEILYDDYFSGVFYDEVSDEITWVGDVALASMPTNDINQNWRDAYTELFSYTRDLIGEEKIIISNGSANLQHAPYVNGRMYESFPTPWEQGGDWHEIMDQYFEFEDAVAYDPIIVFNSDTDNTGDNTDYQKVRFGLASALLGGAFFGFDFGTQEHAQLWRYDEYDTYLGLPTDPVQELDSGIFLRDFTNGQVLVNPTSESQTISLGGEFEKIHGLQDPIINDGSIISRITLNALDAILLLRPLEEIINATFLNGSFARIFNMAGETSRTGFFTYDSNFLGGMEVMSFDIDLDGNQEFVAADDREVFIFHEDGSLFTSFFPYTESYNQGINFDIADLENDGSVEIVTGTKNGGGAHLRIFNHEGVLINPGFFGFDEAFRGGVHVAIGDLNADGFKEIIVGAGVGGGPHVRVFNKNGDVINPGFFARHPDERFGVPVSVGDINGDGIDDIITGSGIGGNPEIRIYNKDGHLMADPFLALEDQYNQGIDVTTADLDGNGIDEIIALTNDVFTLSDY